MQIRGAAIARSRAVRIAEPQKPLSGELALLAPSRSATRVGSGTGRKRERSAAEEAGRGLVCILRCRCPGWGCGSRDP
ncbi:GATA transcription factor [Musa troglodytarum]|uniref:GATA transcription factor n=1 Tax=Musa troglodytarum TaxID=320322 RepID=A0A9E7GK31_9LILI|nr:GATA transcription factor [Musa troglodytarum]